MLSGFGDFSGEIALEGGTPRRTALHQGKQKVAIKFQSLKKDADVERLKIVAQQTKEKKQTR